MSAFTEANPFHENCGPVRPDPLSAAAGLGDTRARRPGRKRPPLFNNVMVEDGKKRRATKGELREAYRLWAVHKDIREARYELR